MLYAFGFERVSVLVSDLYFIDPAPLEGQETAERGVRLELRMLERGELKGSIYSAQPIGIGEPSVAGGPAGIGRQPARQPGPGPSSPVVRRLGARRPGLRPGAVR